MTAALVAQAIAPGTLPTPREITTFVSTLPITIVSPLPPPVPRGPMVPGVLTNAAPLEPPSGVAPETGDEHATSRAFSGAVDGGIDAGVRLGGVAILPPPPSPPPPPPPSPVRLRSGMEPPRRPVTADPPYPRPARTPP